MPNERARALRRNQTDAEKKLWSVLRRDQLGHSFRRQHPMGPYIVDFICLQARLVIEADGGQHSDDRAEHDAKRTAWLEARGYKVLRFWNSDILQNIEGVTEVIRISLEESR
ncbi:MAG: endonuclease domain-containing protein [Parvibaculum sp.]|uniref:endonuclease domain-containing protein n=1 Tax=Parvibaculum sp. TaxID=2024848 RepID=UPI00284EDF39|nr:endonuclease domain-containing protein [Parvibaculum sp.]MDR3498745.1 endonuclease domain-containing protein [Parvibaculum sp.]